MNYRLTSAPSRPSRRQGGFSLVELSVAMVVAVFLLAGLFSVLQGTRDTSNSQTGIAQLQDNQRFAMSVFTNMIESAGYFPITQPDGTPNTLTGSLAVDGTDYPTAGQSVTGGGNGTAGDMIMVRFQTNPNDGISSCLGHTNTGAGATPKVYKVKLQVDSTQNALTCSDGNGVTAIPLVPGVQKLEVTYGVNSTSGVANSNCPADTYYDTAHMTTTLQWTNVCSVAVKLTFVNPLRTPIPGKVDLNQPATVTFTKVITVMSKAGHAVVFEG